MPILTRTIEIYHLQYVALPIRCIWNFVNTISNSDYVTKHDDTTITFVKSYTS